MAGDRSKLWVTGALFAFGALVVSGCADAAGPEAESASDPLTIGISLSMTGEFADLGRAAGRGYELWEEEVNRRGGILGREVRLKIVDDTSQPSQVVNNYRTLVTQDQVDLVFGPVSSRLTIPAAQVAARYDYAFLEPTAGGPEVFARQLDNLFFVQPAPATHQGLVFADYILSRPADERPRTAAYPALDDPVAVSIAEKVRNRFEAAGIETVYADIYPPTLNDLSPVVSAVAEADPDVVVAGTQAEDAYAMVEAMIQLDFAPNRLFLANGANSPAEFPDKVGQDNVNGIFSAGDWFPTTTAEGSEDFAEAYVRMYGGVPEEIDATSAAAYSCGMLLEQVAEQAGKIDNATIIETLHSGVWQTLLGELSWDGYGVPQGSYLLVQWVSGQLVPVYPEDSARHPPVEAPLAWAE